MNNKLITTIVLGVVILFGVGAVALNSKDSSSESMPGMSQDQMSGSDKEADTEAATEPNMVTYKGFAVVQKSIKVKKGTTVTWTNKDDAKHDVTPVTETAEFTASELFGKGETYSVTFNTVGKFDYFCSPHPYMKGTVEVTE